MSIEYRVPGVLDVDQLVNLGRETFVATFGHLYSRDDLDPFLDETFRPAGIRNELSNPAFRYKLAQDSSQDNLLIAYCKTGPLRVPIATEGNAQEIWQLYVRSPYHGRGVAQELMHWALSQCAMQGAQEIYLSVWSGNQRAIRFYERFGFSHVGSYDYMVGKHADHEFIFRLAL